MENLLKKEAKNAEILHLPYRILLKELSLAEKGNDFRDCPENYAYGRDFK